MCVCAPFLFLFFVFLSEFVIVGVNTILLIRFSKILSFLLTFYEIYDRIPTETVGLPFRDVCHVAYARRFFFLFFVFLNEFVIVGVNTILLIRFSEILSFLLTFD